MKTGRGLQIGKYRVDVPCAGCGHGVRDHIEFQACQAELPGMTFHIDYCQCGEYLEDRSLVGVYYRNAKIRAEIRREEMRERKLEEATRG